MFRYCLLDRGDTAPVTREIIRRHQPDPTGRPGINVRRLTLHRPCKGGTAEADAWVATQLTAIFAGQADRAAQEMTTQADQAGLRDSRREFARCGPLFAGGRPAGFSRSCGSRVPGCV
jgi:hypothetical protein